MAGNAPELRIVGSINKDATRKAIQADLDKISKSLTLTIGVGQNGKTDLGKSMKVQADSVKNSYKAMGDANAEFSIKFAKSLEKREALQRKLMVSQDKYITKVKNNTEKEIALKEKLIAKINELQTQTTRNASALGKYKLNTEEKTSLNSYVSDMKNLGDVTGKTGKELQSMVTKAHTATRGIRDLGTEVKASGRTALKFSEYIKNAFVGFSTWSIVTVSWYLMVNMLKDGVKAVYELDTALLELRKVTDLSGASMDMFINRASEVGSSLSRTTKEVVSATAEFAKMGYTVSQSLDLAKDALMLTNISDGAAEIEDSTSTIITVLKGYGMEASESTRIIDGLNEVSNKYAVSTSDLSSAVQRISSVMKVSGTTFEESLGLFTAMNEVMQDAPRAANSLKTITMRLRGLSEEGETLESGFTAKLEDAYQRVAGVSIMMNGELRSTYDIVTDLGKKWGGLTDTQKSYLSQLSAGVWQAQGFASLMENIDVAVGATTDALNSEGSALAENEKRMDSISGKLTSLTGKFQNLWTNALNSEFVKVILDLGIAIVSTMDSIGLFTTAMIALGIVFVRLGGLQTLAIASMYALDVITGKVTLTTLAATGAFGALGTAMNLIPIVAIVTGIGLVISQLVKVSNETKRYNELLKENKDRLNDLLGTGQEQELTETIDKIKDAQKAVEEYRKATQFGGASGIGGGIDSGTASAYRNAKMVLAEYGLTADEVSEALSKLESKKKSLINTIQEETSSHRSMTQILDDEKSVIDGLEQSANDLQSTVEKLNDGQKINGIELLKLIDNYPQLIKYIDKNNNLVITKEQLEKELWNTEKEIAIDRLESYKNEMLAKKANFDATVIYYEKYLQMAESMSFLESGLSEAMLNDARNALLSAKKGILEANKELTIVETKIKVVSGSSLSDFYSKDSKENKDKKDILSNFSAQEKAVSDLAYEMDILGKKTELAEGDKKIALQKEAIGLYGEQQEAVHQYSNAIRALIAKGGLSKEDLETLNNQLRENGKEWWGIETATKSLADTMANDLKKAQEDVLALQKENKDVVNELRDAISKLVEEELKDQINSHKEAIESAKEELDIRLKQIDAEKELSGFSKDRADKESDIVKLASKINSLRVASEQGDMNATNQIITLEEERAKIQEELDELINDRSFDLRKEGLEAQYNEFEKTQNDEIKIIEDNLDDVAYVAKMVNEKINSSTETLFNDMIKYSSEYGTSFEADVIAKWEKALALIREYNSALQGGSGSFDFKDYNGGSAKDTVLNQMRANKSLWTNASPEEKKRLNQANISLGKSIGYSYKPSDGNYYSDSDGSKLVFDNGGRFNQGDTAIKANSTPEWINTDKQLQSLIHSGVSEFTQSLLSGAIPNIGGVQSNPSISVVINGSVDDKNINRITQELKNISTTVSQGQLDAMRGRGIKPSTRIR